MDSNIKFVGKYSLKKTFNSPEEFNKYYLKHKDEIDSKTSNQLNKEYKINDFKITKRNVKIIDGKKQGDLFLKPIKTEQSQAKEDNDFCIELDEIKAKINILTESYTNIINILNSLASTQDS